MKLLALIPNYPLRSGTDGRFIDFPRFYVAEPIKHLLIGSPKAVTNTQRYLHQLGYARIGDWSALLPSPENPLEVMSILVKQILVQ